MTLTSTSPNKKRDRGAAIVLTLAMVSLMTLLIISFFTMVASTTAAVDHDEAQMEAKALGDSALNQLINQLRQATTTESAIWTSQPGAIKVWNQEGGLDRVWKLYSSSSSTAQSEQELSGDLPKDWQSDELGWVDLNAPAQLHASDGRAEPLFPILDPRLKSARSDETPEGFDYSAKGGLQGVVGPEKGDNAQRCPMPVRWIYVLKDGTLGLIDRQGIFTSAKGGGQLSRRNPIVGRIAWWTDDESCKINLNTASEGVYWDTPRVSTSEDAALADNQPTHGEYQRHPGHPATVCLSSVLFPHRRLSAQGGESAELSSQLQLPLSKAAPLWQHSPGLSRDAKKTSYGGTVSATTLKAPELSAEEARPDTEPFRTYATIDDYALAAQPSSGGLERKLAASVSHDPKALQRLMRSKFLLTTSSEAPETTLFGTPKINLWPIHAEVDPSDGDIAAHATAFDELSGFVSTINGETFCLRRQEPRDGWKDMFITGQGHNLKLLSYLQALTSQPVPGFGSQSFADKYGEGDEGDRDQILTLMLDAMRNTNLLDPAHGNDWQFSLICTGNPGEGYGQIAPICLLGGAQRSSQRWPSEEMASKAPRGIGRFPVVTEASLVFTCMGEKSDSDVQGTAEHSLLNRDYPRSLKTEDLKKQWTQAAPGSQLIEISLLLECFIPAQGWVDYRPYLSASLSGVDRDNPSNVDEALPSMSYCGSTLEAIPQVKDKAVIRTSFPPPAEWTAWGGTMGARAFSNTESHRYLRFQPVVVHAGQQGVDFSGTPPLQPIQLNIYDDPSSAGNGSKTTNDLISVVRLEFPRFSSPNAALRPRLPAATKARSFLDRWKQAQNGTSLLNDDDVVQSLVMLHGDARLHAARRLIDRVNDIPMLVPHPQWGQVRMAHSLREPTPKGFELLVQRSDSLKTDESTQSYFKDINVAPYYAPDLPWRLDGKPRTARIWMPGGNMAQWFDTTELLTKSRRDRGARGPAWPSLTGDFDTGSGCAPDGPYVSRPDDGDVRGWIAGSRPYFNVAEVRRHEEVPPSSQASFVPMRLCPSAGIFGSLPTGVKANVPWQTLLLRPWKDSSPATRNWNRNQHYGWKAPRDHLFLDLFWMPVVEPWGVSTPFATAGKINLNHQMIPFSHITRKTALHALLKSEKLLAIPDAKAATAKLSDPNSLTQPVQEGAFRHYIDADATIRLWDEERKAAGGAFLSPTQLCEHYLVPEGEPANREAMDAFWERHRLTGDNVKERPYSVLYPKLTTRSNSFRVHIWAESLRMGRGSVEKFSTSSLIVSARQRYSCLVSRSLDPTHPSLPRWLNTESGHRLTSLEPYYSYRISQVREFRH